MSEMCKELANLGASPCAFPLKIARRLVFVPLYKNNGTKNGLTLDEVEVLQNWHDNFDSYVPLNKYYVLPVMENVTDERGDTEFFTWESGLKARIQQGVRTFTGLIPNEWPSLLGKLQAWEGQKFGVYIVDKAGAIVFNYGLDTNGVPMAYPIPVDGNSFDAKLIKATYSDPGSIMVQFDFDADVNDKDLYLKGDLDFDPRTGDFYSPTDVYGDDDTPNGWDTLNTVYTVKLTLDYGVPASGFDDPTFWVYENDAPPPAGDDAVVTTVTEVKGLYTVTLDKAGEINGYVSFAPPKYTRFDGVKIV